MVHLLGYQNSKDDYTQPVEVTQGGMSDRLDLRQNTISYALNGLNDSGHVKEKVSRVRGKEQRMKTYFLTEEGLKKAKKKRKEMRESSVTLDMYGEEREVLVKNVDEYVPKDQDLIDIVLKREEGGIKIRVGGEKGSPISYRSELLSFDDSEKLDISILKDWYRNGEDPALVRDISPYHIAAFLETLKETTNIFYFRVEKHKRPIDLWDAFSDFLQGIGKINLSTYRDFAEWLNPRTALEKLKSDLKYTSALLIFDGIDEGSELRDIILKISEETLNFQHVRTLMDFEEDQDGVHIEEASFLNADGFSPLRKRVQERYGKSDFSDVLTRELNLEVSLTLSYLSIFRKPVESHELARLGPIAEEDIEEILETPLVWETEGDKITIPTEIRKRKLDGLSKTAEKDLQGLASKYYEERIEPSTREILERLYHLVMSGEIKKAENLLEDHGSMIVSDGYSRVLLDMLAELGDEEKGALFDFYEAEAMRVDHEYEDSRQRYEEMLTETEDKRWELRAYLGLGKVEEKLGRYDRAIHNLNRAEEIAKTLEDDPEKEDQLGRIYARRGEIWNKNDDYEKAKKDLEKAIETLVHGEDHHLLTSSYFILARMEKERGKEGEAIEPFKMGLKFWSRLDESHGPISGKRETGTLYEVLKELEDAEIRFRTQFHTDRAGPIQGEYEDLKTAALLSLAECHMENESYEKAIKSAEDAMESVLSEDKRERAFTEALLGKAYLETEREVEAEDHLSRAISLYKELGQQYQLGLTYFSMAKVHEKKDDPEALAENYRKAVLSLSKSGAEQKAEKVKREMENIPISM